MHAKYSVIDQRRHGHVVEQIDERAPQLETVASLALVKEAEDPRDLLAFMVPAEQEDVLGVLDLVCEQEAHCLDTLLPAVNVVTQEEVVLGWWLTIALKHAEKVKILSMDVTSDVDGTINPKQHRFFFHHLERSLDQRVDLILEVELDKCVHVLVLDRGQLLDDGIYVKRRLCIFGRARARKNIGLVILLCNRFTLLEDTLVKGLKDFDRTALASLRFW